MLYTFPLKVPTIVRKLTTSRKLDDNIAKLALFENKIRKSLAEGNIKKAHAYMHLLQISDSLISSAIKPISRKLQSANSDEQHQQLKSVILHSIDKIQQLNIKLENAIKNNKSKSKVISILLLPY
jgi:hypothetical protein